MKKSELRQMIREVLREELYANKGSTENRYIAISGEFPTNYHVYTVTPDEESAYVVYEELLYSGDHFQDLELAYLFDLSREEIRRLESMVGKTVTGADADFIAEFFTEGSRVDSLHNNFD
jgi:hypothetical protein